MPGKRGIPVKIIHIIPYCDEKRNGGARIKRCAGYVRGAKSERKTGSFHKRETAGLSYLLNLCKEYRERAALQAFQPFDTVIDTTSAPRARQDS